MRVADIIQGLIKDKKSVLDVGFLEGRAILNGYLFSVLNEKYNVVTWPSEDDEPYVDVSFDEYP